MRDSGAKITTSESVLFQMLGESITQVNRTTAASFTDFDSI